MTYYFNPVRTAPACLISELGSRGNGHLTCVYIHILLALEDKKTT